MREIMLDADNRVERLEREVQRLYESGKPPNLAFIAVARRLRVALNAIARERGA
jgi:hypothetical protein